MVTLVHPPASENASPDQDATSIQPYPVRHISSPVVGLPRHHHRTPSIGRQPIKETVDACASYESDEEGNGGVRVNQYVLKQEIGRGSFGAVYVAVDGDGKKYAVKEFSKSRLRKRSQSQLLRRPSAAIRRSQGGFLSPGPRRPASEIYKEQEAGNPLYLIRGEIAILKKLDHENVINLIEVLDDPEGDSLYMVFEMCEKGVVMKVDLDRRAEPYPEEQCRLWFRDMLLGIEYLHAQGIIHRDIKPDNLLLTADDVLKIVDFGVSEIFEKDAPMVTAKTAGSPAFLPPELCVPGHGDVSGTAADIWSMGVTLYCLMFGCLPFNHGGVLELYASITNDEPQIPDTASRDLVDLFKRILEKDPAKRIKMPELREHLWVTCGGADKLLSAEENTADFITLTEEEMADAISSSIHNAMAVVRAVRKLKRLTLGRSKSPSDTKSSPAQEVPRRTQSLNTDDHVSRQQQLFVSGVNTEISPDNPVDAHSAQKQPARSSSALDGIEQSTSAVRTAGELETMQAIPPYSETPTQRPDGAL